MKGCVEVETEYLIGARMIGVAWGVILRFGCPSHEPQSLTLLFANYMSVN